MPSSGVRSGGSDSNVMWGCIEPASASLSSVRSILTAAHGLPRDRLDCEAWSERGGSYAAGHSLNDCCSWICWASLFFFRSAFGVGGSKGGEPSFGLLPTRAAAGSFGTAVPAAALIGVWLPLTVIIEVANALPPFPGFGAVPG